MNKLEQSVRVKNTGLRLVHQIINCFHLHSEMFSWFPSLCVENSLCGGPDMDTLKPKCNRNFIITFKCDITVVITSESLGHVWFYCHVSGCQTNEHISVLDRFTSDEAQGGGSFFCFKYLELFILVNSCSYSQRPLSTHRLFSKCNIAFWNRWTWQQLND